MMNQIEKKFVDEILGEWDFNTVFDWVSNWKEIHHGLFDVIYINQHVHM